MKRVLIISDLHVGHKDAICPPDWWGGGRDTVFKLSENWEWFEHTINKNKPYDCLIVLGDAVQGAGVKNANEVVINTNMQQDAAVYTIDMVESPVIYYLVGTEVHVQSGGHELEPGIAYRTGGTVHKQAWIGVDDHIIDVRHHPAGKSTVYPGNPLHKEYETNVKWAREGLQPQCTLLMRGHVHSMYDCGVANRWHAYSCPALQDVGDRYGARLSNICHYGIGFLDFIDGEDWPIWRVKEKPRTRERVFTL